LSATSTLTSSAYFQQHQDWRNAAD